MPVKTYRTGQNSVQLVRLTNSVLKSIPIFSMKYGLAKKLTDYSEITIDTTGPSGVLLTKLRANPGKVQPVLLRATTTQTRCYI